MDNRSSPYTFRAVTADDAALLYQLRHSAITEKAKDHYPPDVVTEWAEAPGVDWDEKYREEAQDPNIISRLILYHDKPVGFGQILLRERTFETVYVAPFAHQKDDPKAGMALMAHMEELAFTDYGVTTLMANAVAGMIDIYEKNNWIRLNGPKAKPTPTVMHRFNGNKELIALPCYQIYKSLTPT